MRRAIADERARSWVVDYSAARTRAIKWLGDRYLLARPINARTTAWRPASPDRDALPGSL
jgi:hypothetical protein